MKGGEEGTKLTLFSKTEYAAPSSSDCSLSKTWQSEEEPVPWIQTLIPVTYQLRDPGQISYRWCLNRLICEMGLHILFHLLERL